MQIPAKNFWKNTHERPSVQDRTIYSKSWILNYYLFFHNFKFVVTQLSLVGQFIEHILLVQTGSISQALIHVLTVPFKELHSVCEAGLPFAHEMSEMQFANCSVSFSAVICVCWTHIHFILTCFFSQKYSWNYSLQHTSFYLLRKIINYFGVLNKLGFFSAWNTGYAIVRVKRNSVVLIYQSSKWVPYHCKNGCISLPLSVEISQLFLVFISSAREKVNFE